ncbi:hypothetical protein [Jatrophihabitans sp.]|uniref:hypothetical protein n=1 Tax=Jatrophihabitans sp. TaxID=1932789 RepID=UPI0030C6B495|nr:hypothetical protein [Jatrophihabitans sp.]
MSFDEVSITSALEQLALALGKADAVPRSELIRALERAAERLRTGGMTVERPHDLITQSEAARLVGVSRQAVHQWVQKGMVPAHRAGASGRNSPMVSLSEVLVTANRTTEAPFSRTLRQQFLQFLSLVGGLLDDRIVDGLTRQLDPGPSTRRREEASRVLREFVMAAMGTSSMQQEFTPAGVQMLADMRPRLPLDPDSSFGRLCEVLGLLVHSSRGEGGFDSAAIALMALLGAATVGASLDHPDAPTGRRLAEAAEEVWGEEWVGRMLDIAFHVEELAPTPLSRYTASLSYLGVNRFLRQAQSSGVSVSYARSPGLMLPECFYGEPVLADVLQDGTSHRRASERMWRFSPGMSPIAVRAMQNSEGNPFRPFTFDRAILDTSIHGVRRYCFSMQDTRVAFRKHVDELSGTQRSGYIELAVETLTQTLSCPLIELVAIERLPDFDWWKDHIIRSSSREIMLGLRNARARKVAHALLVQTTLLPDVVEAADNDSSLRDRLRIYVKNLEFGIVDDRYHDDLRRGVARPVKTATESLDESEARSRAEHEIEQLLAPPA